MKYRLIRENALMQSLNIHRRMYDSVYVSEMGILPYDEGAKEIRKVMLTEPNCICDLMEVIAALKSSDSESVEIEHMELPERVIIGGVEVMYNQNNE